METANKAAKSASARAPLVVDLDGTLINSDLLVESAFAHVGQDARRAGGVLSALFRGRAALKAHIASETEIDAARLPYNSAVVELIKLARAEGRPVYLASASNERYVRAVAAHLGLFSGWFASTASENLKAAAKAERLVKEFGEGGFDYIGNDADDLKVWAKARKRTAIHPPSAVEKKLFGLDPAATVLRREASQLRHWGRMLRVHQWATNLLVFAPFVTAQRYDFDSFANALAAFVAFCLVAAGMDLINDLVDLGDDRKHRSKKRRPLAAGAISVLDALIVAPVVISMGAVMALTISPGFFAVLLGYLLLSTAYIFGLKRKMIIGVVALAMLYTLRVIAGAAAIAAPVSASFLALSMCIFMALALITRSEKFFSAGRNAAPHDPAVRG